MLVSTLCDRRLIGSKVGVEIEIEGVSPPDWLTHWQIKDEGSLRQGFEVVSQPLFLADVPVALREVKDILQSADDSDRTSVHVHVNASDLSTLGVIKLVCLYMTIERALISEHGMRENNNYCVPLYSLHSPLEFAKEMWNAGRMIAEHHNKYCALNILPLRGFGTVEFRGMGFISDVDKLYEWVEICHSIRIMSQKINLNEFKRRGVEYLLELSDEFPKIKSMLLLPSSKIGAAQAIMEVYSCAA